MVGGARCSAALRGWAGADAALLSRLAQHDWPLCARHRAVYVRSPRLSRSSPSSHSTFPPAGDTPRGMVESAFEFADICRDMDYHNFVFSMKVCRCGVSAAFRQRPCRPVLRQPLSLHGLPNVEGHRSVRVLTLCGRAVAPTPPHPTPPPPAGHTPPSRLVPPRRPPTRW